MTKEIFEYDDNGGGIMPKGHFRIGASQISRFFTNTNQWYRENLLNETGFVGSTASVLGTCVHAVAECVATDVQPSKDLIEEFIYKQASENPDVIASDVIANYTYMSEALVNDYLLDNMPTNSEDFLYEEILPGIGVGGSCDAAILPDDKQSGLIIDYKTTGALTAPTTISYGYKLQLLTYAWLYKQQGHYVDRIRIVYVTRNQVGRVSEKTGKPLKDYPSKTTTITEQITDEDFDMIEGIINVIAHSVQHWQNNPEHRHLLAQDWRLNNAKH